MNVPDSKMTKMVDKVIYTDAGEEVAVPSTKVYVAQIVYMILLGHFMAASCEKDLTYIKDGLNSIADEYEKILKEKESISKIAKKKVVDFWRTMNQWVYDGFDATYKMMGVDFDKIYYESETYLVGKEEVLRGFIEDRKSVV